jgi:hypothetical protein
MSQLATHLDYRGHMIKIHVRPAPHGDWAWGYSIPTLKHKVYGERPVSSYDEVLTAALDDGKRRIDAFEDRLEESAAAAS